MNWIKYFMAIVLVIVVFTPSAVFAWNCDTHTIIAEAAGYGDVDACQPDAKPRSYQHWENVPVDATVTAQDFYSNTYGGELYTTIMDANATIADVVHGIGDLTQPLHNVVYDEFNKTNHRAWDNAAITTECIEPVYFDHVDAAVLADIANLSQAIGYSRTMDTDTACYMASISVGLLKAMAQ